MAFIPHTQAEVDAMLDVIGVAIDTAPDLAHLAIQGLPCPVLPWRKIVQ